MKFAPEMIDDLMRLNKLKEQVQEATAMCVNLAQQLELEVDNGDSLI